MPASVQFPPPRTPPYGSAPVVTPGHGDAPLTIRPQVTVIVPAYNAAATLELAVRSVMRQTMPDLEIIVVDDASSDATCDVAQRLQLLDDRIRIERLACNGGKSFVMNHATGLARGKWIALLDADDWYAPDRLERLIDAAEAAGADMVADNLAFVDSHAKLCSGTGFPERGVRHPVDLDAFLEMSNPTARYDYGMLQPIFRADFIRMHDINYYQPARIGEDFYQLLCFFAAGGRAIVLDTPLYFYVEPFGAISRRWAQPNRSRYRFESMLETHRHFASLLAERLSPRQQALLRRREAGITAMILLHQTHECVRKGDIRGALHRVFRAPARLWLIISRKLASRLRALLFPPQGSPVPDPTYLAPSHALRQRRAAGLAALFVRQGLPGVGT